MKKTDRSSVRLFAGDPGIQAAIAAARAALPPPPAIWFRMALDRERLPAITFHWARGPMTLCLKTTSPMVVADSFSHPVDCKECVDARSAALTADPPSIQPTPEEPSDELDQEDPLRLAFRF